MGRIERRDTYRADLQNLIKAAAAVPLYAQNYHHDRIPGIDHVRG